VRLLAIRAVRAWGLRAHDRIWLTHGPGPADLPDDPYELLPEPDRELARTAWWIYATGEAVLAHRKLAPTLGRSDS